MTGQALQASFAALQHFRIARLKPTVDCGGWSLRFTTPEYKLFPVPAPRNQHREVFLHEVFVPHPFALIDLPSFYLQGKYSLFAAHRLANAKNGQLVTFEPEADARKFSSKFDPD